MIRRNKGLIAALGLVAILIAAGWWGVQAFGRYLNDQLAPKPESIAAASLAGIREQNRLSAFTARYFAVVLSEPSRTELRAQETLIMARMVRYEVDLGRLTQKDVAWDGVAMRLSVTLPPVELSGPEVDLNAIREYDNGGLLLRLTDAEKALDTANRTRAQQELLVQARAPAMLKLARDATRRAVERSFAMPLKAAGVDATVAVRFADEPQPAGGEQMDRSRSLEEIFANRTD